MSKGFISNCSIYDDEGQIFAPLFISFYEAKFKKKEGQQVPFHRQKEEQFKKQSYESALFYAIKRVVKHLNAVLPDLDLIAFYEKELKDLKEKGGDEK
jgi:predicted adenine nucleotide alpha hydrolase (AANH) superfamily ATPase